MAHTPLPQAAGAAGAPGGTDTDAAQDLRWQRSSTTVGNGKRPGAKFPPCAFLAADPAVPPPPQGRLAQRHGRGSGQPRGGLRAQRHPQRPLPKKQRLLQGPAEKRGREHCAVEPDAERARGAAAQLPTGSSSRVPGAEAEIHRPDTLRPQRIESLP